LNTSRWVQLDLLSLQVGVHGDRTSVNILLWFTCPHTHAGLNQFSFWGCFLLRMAVRRSWLVVKSCAGAAGDAETMDHCAGWMLVKGFKHGGYLQQNGS